MIKHPNWILKYTEPISNELPIGTRIMILSEDENYGKRATITGYHYTKFAIPSISYHIMPDEGLEQGDTWVMWAGEFKVVNNDIT